MSRSEKSELPVESCKSVLFFEFVLLLFPLLFSSIIVCFGTLNLSGDVTSPFQQKYDDHRALLNVSNRRWKCQNLRRFKMKNDS